LLVSITAPHASAIDWILARPEGSHKKHIMWHSYIIKV